MQWLKNYQPSVEAREFRWIRKGDIRFAKGAALVVAAINIAAMLIRSASEPPTRVTVEQSERFSPKGELGQPRIVQPLQQKQEGK